jgi:hypothetical protein
MASSSDATGITGSTGPKISCRSSSESGYRVGAGAWVGARVGVGLGMGFGLGLGFGFGF